jgi:hypothetical protein
MNREEAYTYRSFEHHKRETFGLITAIAATLGRELRVADLGCGPAVLDAILIDRLPGAIATLDLLDVSDAFLAAARGYLADGSIVPQYHRVDFNKPETLPTLTGRGLRVVLINHQTMANRHPGFPPILKKHCACLDNLAPLDVLDAELARRSLLDMQRAAEKEEQGGGYAGLALTAGDHQAILSSAGFVSDEVWRKGNSVMLLAAKP